MSTKDKLLALEAAGTLTRYAPYLRKPLKRRLFFAPDAANDFNNPKSATNVLCGRGFIASSLDRWVTGGRVFGNKKRGLFLDRLDPPPPEIWEVRVTEPSVQARLFGRFAEPDTLILTKFHTRNLLGDKGSADWNRALAACQKCWNDLFPEQLPHTGVSIFDYVTENCDDFPI